MKLEESFEVDAPVEEVWKALIDVERVAPCLPGAEITDASEDGTYEGNFQVKLGPTTAAYRGTLNMESVDEGSRTATMNASGRDKRGQGSAKATMVSRVTGAESGGARVHVDTDFTITGRLARFGRGGMIQDISKRLLGDFAACLQEELRGAGAQPQSGSDGSATPPPADKAEPQGASGPGGSGAVAGQSTAPGSTSATPPGSPSPPPSSVEPSGPAAASQSSGPAAQPARPQAKPVQGFSLLLSVLRARLRDFLARRRKSR